MNQDFLTLLQEKTPEFSKGQRRIAQYITEAYDKAAFMTASRLGKTVGVSESTVVRFAVDLGFDGYPSMQKAMQEMVLNRLTSVQRIEVANDRLGDQDVVSMVFRSDIEKLRQTEETVSREEFSNAVNAILKAKRVYILGVRSVAPLANFLGYYLNYMFNNVHVITGMSAGEMFERIVGVNSEDVVIAFSFPRYSASTTKGARYCCSAGAKVIGITDSRLSPDKLTGWRSLFGRVVGVKGRISLSVWLERIANAEFVVTNSFHGTVFSILFKRQFVTPLIHGDMVGMNERVVSLLDELNLADRMIDDGRRISRVIEKPIDWNDVYSRLDVWRKRTDDFFSFNMI